jgi:hypothetical protein
LKQLWLNLKIEKTKPVRYQSISQLKCTKKSSPRSCCGVFSASLSRSARMDCFWTRRPQGRALLEGEGIAATGWRH